MNHTVIFNHSWLEAHTGTEKLSFASQSHALRLRYRTCYILVCGCAKPHSYVICLFLNLDWQMNYGSNFHNFCLLRWKRVSLQKVFQMNSMFLNIIVMTLGEIEYNDIFLETNLAPFGFDVRLILFVFLFLMPIVLMNLLVRTHLWMFKFLLFSFWQVINP
jgi:hypothetical protein